jgi:hypothetical protein
MTLLSHTSKRLVGLYQSTARDVHRIIRLSSIVPTNHGTSRSKAFLSTEAFADLRKQGIMDERDLLQFSTLHELQRNASLAFGDHPLFGTYQKKEGQDASFEFMTYKEFGTAVDNCRTVLKDLGKLNCSNTTRCIFELIWFH